MNRIRSPRTWSLRTRLLVTQIALLAVVCAGIGIATEFALQRFLMHQLDEQVHEAGRRSAMIFDMPPLPPPPATPGYARRQRFDPELGPGPGFLGAPGQSARTVGAVISHGLPVDAGVARSRSEALAWAVRLVGQHADDWLTELRAAMESVEEVRGRGPSVS